MTIDKTVPLGLALSFVNPMGLLEGEKVVMFALIDALGNNPGGEVVATAQRLTKVCNRTIRAVQRYTANLLKKGVVTKRLSEYYDGSSIYKIVGWELYYTRYITRFNMEKMI